MARWIYALGGTPASGNGAQRELTQAYGRTATWRLDAAGSASFTIDGASDEIASWGRLATDLYVRRNGSLLGRYRVGPEQGGIRSSGHVVSLTGTDYRAMLDTKQVPGAGADFAATDQGVIAWTLISAAQARTNGSLGITNGIGSTSGTTRDRHYDPGKPIGQAIAELGRVDNGFEWEVDANLALNRWYPKRGSDQGVVLDYGGAVLEVEYSFDPSSFGNVAMAIGDQATVPVEAVSATIASDLRGRWERSQASPTMTVQANVAGRAPALLDELDTIRVDYRVTLRPDWWQGKTHIWLGDTVYLTVRSGRVFEEEAPHRVVEITATPGEAGTENVQLALVAA